MSNSSLWAQQKAANRENLKDAVRAGEARKIEGALSATGTLLNDWPSCAALLAEARQLVDLLVRLERAKGTPEMAAFWDRHSHDLASHPEAANFRREAADWKRRNEALERVRQVVSGGSNERAIADAWVALEAINSHPEAAKYEKRALDAVARIEGLERVKKLLVLPPSEDADRQIVSAWNKTLMDPWTEANSARPQVESARQRLDVLQKVATQSRLPEGAEKERLIVEAAVPLPPKYAFPLSARVETARLRSPAYKDLETAIKSNSDVRIARAWDAAQTVMGSAIVINQTEKARCRTAYLRREALDRISTAIPGSMPEHEQDNLWIALWTAEVDNLLRPSVDAAKVLARYQKARSRLDDLIALKASLDAPHPVASRIQELADRLQGYPPIEEYRARIDSVLADFRRIQAITAGLDQYIQAFSDESEKQDADRKIRKDLNLEILSRYPDEFLRHRSALERWFKERVLHHPPHGGGPGGHPASGGPARGPRALALARHRDQRASRGHRLRPRSVWTLRHHERA